MIIPISLFFHNIGLNLAQILPLRPQLFFADFQRNMLGDSINIDNFCCNPAILKKKLVKPLKIGILGPNLHYKGVRMCHSQNKKQIFLAEVTKDKSSLSSFRNFLFYKNVIRFLAK